MKLDVVFNSVNFNSFYNVGFGSVVVRVMGRVFELPFACEDPVQKIYVDIDNVNTCRLLVMLNSESEAYCL